MTNHLGRKAMIGAGLLSALVAGSFSSAALARPSRDDVRDEHKDVKEARKEVRQERKDVRRADTPPERHEARGDLRDANQKLRRETWEYQREKAKRDGTDNRNHDNRYGSYNNGNRYGNRYGNSNGYYNNGNRYGNGNGYYNNGKSYGNSNGYNNGSYRNNGGGYYNQSNRITREGVVVADTRGDSFIMRNKHGQTFRVVVSGGEPRRLSRGDVVRVEGFDNGSTFRASDVNIIRNR